MCQHTLAFYQKQETNIDKGLYSEMLNTYCNNILILWGKGEEEKISIKKTKLKRRKQNGKK